MPTVAEWQAVHWHAYSGARTIRLDHAPDATLHSPWQVAQWIDEHTRQHVLRREVFALRDGVWVTIGDEDDLAHLRHENFLIASRGDSIYTDIYTGGQHHDLYVEAVTDVQCEHDCADSEQDRAPGRRQLPGWWRPCRDSRAGQELPGLREVRQAVLTGSSCRTSSHLLRSSK